MPQDSRNPYKACRESAGYTQEKAAELLNISVESIRAYESDKRPVPGAIVNDMIAVYGTPHLAMQHLTYADVVAKKILPEGFEVKDLPEAVLGILAAVQRFIAKRDLMIQITCDGRIDPEEMGEWQEVLAAVDALHTATLNMRFANTKDRGRS